MENWTDKQINHLVAQWDSSIEMYYPQYLPMWREPEEHFRCLNEEWNLLDAVKFVEWYRYLVKEDLNILDLGGGTGWLSAFLSSYEKVGKIYFLDSSQFFLEKMFPEIVKLMGGKQNKIVPIKGLFSPLLLADESLDMVVASSSLHHAENLESVLKEIYRVLKKNGKLIILNETPYSNNHYLSLNIKQFMSIIRNLLLQNYRPISESISSSGCLYDPYLGDKCYPLWYWEKAIKNAKLKLTEVIKTPYLTNKKETKGIKLTHFVSEKQN